MRKILLSAGICFLMMTCYQVHVLAGDDVAVAKVGERNITRADFKKVIAYFDVERQKMLEANPQLKETVLRQFVQSIVISDLAKKRGFDKDPGIKEQLQFFADNFLANEFLKREIAQKIIVSDDEMKTYYDARPDEFKTPEMVRARHILVKTDDAASDDEKKMARAKAEQYLKKITSGEDFAKWAGEFSDDLGSRARGGDLGFFPKGRMVKPFEDAAFALNPGEVSGIVETPFGFHIIKVEERREAAVETFDAVKERVRQILYQDRTRNEINNFIDKALRDAKTEFFPDALTGEKK